MADSPFLSILHTNYIASDTQCTEIRGWLETPRRKAIALDAEITRLQVLLDDARSKRDELRETIQAHEALVSSLRRLPDDVLREIFIETLPGTRNATFSADEGPLLLSAVCQHWRAVAFSTPRLWCSMHIVVPTDKSESIPMLNSMIALWIQNSGVVPLTISMKLSKTRRLQTVPLPDISDLHARSAAARALLPALLAVSARWRKVQIILSHHDDAALLSALTVEDTPLLQHVQLIHEIPAIASLLPLAMGLPAPVLSNQLMMLQGGGLQNFSYQGRYDSLPQTIPWTSLLHLQLNMPAPHSLSLITFPFHFFEHCPLLETIDITLLGYEIRLPTTGFFLLANLTEATLSMNLRSPTISGRHVFDVMQTPALRSLSLTATFGDDAVGRFFRPISTIQYLHVTLDTLTTHGLTVMLDELDMLEELSLVDEPLAAHGGDRDGEFLAALLPTPTSLRVRCPRLRRLTLAGPSKLSDALILQFLRFRTTNGRLTHFTCSALRQRQLDVAAELADALNAGLVLSLSYHERVKAVQYSPLEGTERDPDWLGTPPMLFYH
ncbi:F-box domain-containing protein [Mycena kentingensis (nom. inval.)]|nr:F-box domain-containing protein [Mycena kentingensis (nom. inval.)]